MCCDSCRTTRCDSRCPQNGADRRLVLRDEAVVAGVARRLLGDHAEAGGVMVAAGDERRARRRAQRRRVEVRVAEAVVGDPVERRRRDHATERRRRTEAHVVGDDQQHVRCALRRNDARRPVGLRLERVRRDRAAEFLWRRRELLPVDRHRRGRGAGCAVDLLRQRACWEPKKNNSDYLQRRDAITTH